MGIIAWIIFGESDFLRHFFAKKRKATPHEEWLFVSR